MYTILVYIIHIRVPLFAIYLSMYHRSFTKSLQNQQRKLQILLTFTVLPKSFPKPIDFPFYRRYNDIGSMIAGKFI